MSATPNPRHHLLPTLLLALLAPFAACAGEQPDSPEAAEAATSATEPTGAADPTEGQPTEMSEAPSASASPKPLPISVRMNGWRVKARLAEIGRFRVDYVSPSRIHLLPLNVVTDATAERWGDIFVWSPTRVYDPTSQERRPLPVDPVAWLRDNPGVEVLREKRVVLGGPARRRGWQFDVERDGSELFGDRDGGLEGAGFERLVLWQVEDTWFLGQAGTFRGKRGLLAPDRRDDVMRQFLATLRYERLS